MMLAIVGVYAQGINFTVNKDLKKAYYLAKINITSGAAPFDIVLNGRHLDQYHLYCQYDVQNIITITDANNTTKTDTIYEANPHFTWGINYYSDQYTDDIFGISYNKIGISIGCSFPDRYNFDINWYRLSDYSQIGFIMNYEPVPDSIWSYIMYQIDQSPVGYYAVRVHDTVHGMDTVVFLEITDPGDTTTTDTTGVDTTATDTTIIDTTGIDTTTTDTTILSLSSCDSVNNSIYPNPTKHFINFTKPVDDVEILSTDGKVVMKSKKKVHRIDVSHLPSGTYFIRVGNTVKKILKI